MKRLTLKKPLKIRQARMQELDDDIIALVGKDAYAELATPTAMKYARAIVLSSGLIRSTARRLNVTHTAVQYMLKTYPVLRRLRDLAVEELIDTAEEELLVAIRNGEGWAVRTALLNHPAGRKRGWSSRQELEHSGEVQVAILPLPEKKMTEDEWSTRFSSFN